MFKREIVILGGTGTIREKLIKYGNITNNIEKYLEIYISQKIVINS